MGPSKLVISLDLQLYWGQWPHRNVEECRDQLLAARRAVPTLLKLFAHRQIRVTWPVVGFLFCRTKQQLLNALPHRIPTATANGRSPYAHIARIGYDERDDPVHFAPSLVAAIAEQPGQEIACHTFSNFIDHDQPQQFEDDLRAAIRVARHNGIILRSLVFPDNRADRDTLRICRKVGITAYRSRPPCWPYDSGPVAQRLPLVDRVRRAARAADAVVPLTGTRCVTPHPPTHSTPVNVPATRRFRSFAARGRPVLAKLQRHRIFTELDRAANDGGIFHLWARLCDFGPRLTPMCDELRRILDRFERWRDIGQMESVTMHEVVTGADTVSEPPRRHHA